MNHFKILICFCALPAAAQLMAPRIGVAIDAEGRLRPIAGVAGDLIPGEPIASGVISSAASDSAVAIKTSSEILVIGKAGTIRTPAASGPAFFAFASDGAPAFAWVASERALFVWTGDGFSRIPLETAAISGSIIAIGASDTAHVNLAVANQGRLEVLRVRLSDGAIDGASAMEDGAHAPLLLPDGAIVYAIPNALVLRDVRGHERQIAFTEPAEAITSMSSGWALVTVSAGRHYAFRLADGAIFRIPEAH